MISLFDQCGYYVSVISGSRKGLLLGPYDNHETAIANVDRGRELAIEADTWAVHYAFGTCSITTPKKLPKSVFGY